MHDAVIVSAVRTPVGKAPAGALRTVRPDDMADHLFDGHASEVGDAVEDLFEDFATKNKGSQ